jgi:hypothetical protein
MRAKTLSSVCASMITPFFLMSANIRKPISDICQSAIDGTNLLTASYNSEINGRLGNETASNINLDLELYEMNKPILYTSWQPHFLFVYRLDVFLSNNVMYKGGFCDWQTFYAPCYLQNLNISFSLTGISNCKYLENYPDVANEPGIIYVDPYYSDNPLNCNVGNLNGITSYNGMESYSDTTPRESARGNYCQRLSSESTYSTSHEEANSIKLEEDICYFSDSEKDITNYMYRAGPISINDSSYHFYIYGSLLFTCDNAPTNVITNFNQRIVYGNNTDWRAYFYDYDSISTQTENL